MAERKRLPLRYARIRGQINEDQVDEIMDIIFGEGHSTERAEREFIERGNCTERISGGYEYLVSYSKGAPVGFVHYKIGKGRLVSSDTAVKPGCRRGGIATKMSLHLAGLARSKGLRYVKASQNSEMQGLVSKYLDGRRKHYGREEKLAYNPGVKSSKKSEHAAWTGTTAEIVPHSTRRRPRK